MIKFNTTALLMLMMNFCLGQIAESHMDKSVRPQDDLYYYVNGSWLKNEEIPADKVRWGTGEMIRDRADEDCLAILNELLQKQYPKNTDEQRVKDLYTSYMDYTGREANGIKPLMTYLQQIDQIKNLNDLQKYLIHSTREGKNTLIGVYVGSHMKKSNLNALYLGGISLGLGRDYYQKNDEKSKEVLRKYTNYIEQLVHILEPEAKDPKTIASNYVAFEKSMAQNMLTVETVRNPELRYNPIAYSELPNLVKNINLQTYISSLTSLKIDTVIIGELGIYKNLDQFVTLENMSTLKYFLKLSLLDKSMTSLSIHLDSIHFDFYNKTISGQKAQRTKEKKALGVVNSGIGEILGKLYVAKRFPPEAKSNAMEMINYLRKSFESHIKDLKWMSEETKKKALEKLAKINVKIGYPDKWKDYSKIQILSTSEGGTYYSNMTEIQKWRFDEMISKLGKPVDKSEWNMTPQTVNAYYSSSFNEIVFPAAILQPPYFDYRVNPSFNFGGIGGVIGHEISHGFDDGGSQYDGDGNFVNWWTKEDKEKFKKATEALADQYSQYEPLPGVFLNGKSTLGENIADLGGLSVSYDAMLSYYKNHLDLKLSKSNYSKEEEFFMSWATVWKSKLRDQEMINRIKTDPHSPGYYRTIGPIVNMDAFYKVYDLKPSDKLYKQEDKRITIW